MLGKCPAFEAVVMAARVVVMRSPIPNLRNNDNCNYRLLFRGYQRELPPRPLRACPMGHPADQIPPSLGAPAVRMDGGGSKAGHPRVGGEHILTVLGVRLHNGSSPRGRGTLAERYAAMDRYRVIPAWAGNTNRARRTDCRPAGHPRVGGEHSNCKQLICREFTACKRATEQYTRFGDAI